MNRTRVASAVIGGVCSLSLAFGALGSALADEAGPAPERLMPIPVAPAAMAPTSGWVALSDSTFRDTLTGWASSSGWTVVWDLDADYRLRASATFDGAFVDAVQAISNSIYDVHPEFLVRIYTGNRVIHVRESSPSTAR